MLSADVPEFIPKALRAKGEAANENKTVENDSSTLTPDAAPTHPDFAVESTTSTTKQNLTSNASSDVNTEVPTDHCDNDSVAKESLSYQTGMVKPTIPDADPNAHKTEFNVRVVEGNEDTGSSTGLEGQAAASGSVPVAQDDGGPPVVASSLRATSAEFYPSGMYHGYNSPTDSPGPHMPYNNPSSHNSPGFMYNKPPYYYETNGFSYYCDSNWTHDLDYNQGYYNSVVNAGHYSAGEFLVPDGGYVYEGDGGFPHQPPQAGFMVDPPYFGPNLTADYRGGFVEMPGSVGAIGRGGNPANGTSSGYNKKYANKNKQKKLPEHVGGRGGGGRQPSNEMSICGQTGELTVGKRRSQGTTVHGRNGSSQQDKVQAANIISNVKNWPTLHTGKMDKEKPSSTSTSGAIAVLDVPDHAPVSTEVKPPMAESVQAPSVISFSSIAKKKSELDCSIAEPVLVPSKKLNPGPSIMKTKKEFMKKNPDDAQKFKGTRSTSVSITGQPSENKTSFPKKFSCNESVMPKGKMEWTLKGKQPNSQQSVLFNASENAVKNDMMQPNSTDGLISLTKSAKKKARKKIKQSAVAAAAAAGTTEQLPLESKEIAVDVPTKNQKSENAVPSIIVNELSNSVVPEKSTNVSVVLESRDEWPSKEVPATVPKSSETNDSNHSIGDAGKYKASASEDIKNKAVQTDRQRNRSSPVNSTVKQANAIEQSSTVASNTTGEVKKSTVASNTTGEAKKPEAVPEELTWVTVGKRSKNKKAFLAKEPAINSLSQNGKTYKNNLLRDKASAPERSMQLSRNKVAIKENSFKDNFLGSPSNNEKVIASKIELSASISSLEINSQKNLDKVESSSEIVVPITPSEPKKRDPSDPEFQKIMKQREIRKEKIKQEKKLNREAAALEKQAMAKKDSKISVMPSNSQKSAKAHTAATEKFAINSEEYPTLGAKKAQKSQPEKPKNSKKEDVKKINGIIQKNLEQDIPKIAETKSKSSLDATTSINVWTIGSKKVASTSSSSQPPIKNDHTTSVPSLPPPKESGSVRPKVFSYSLAAASGPTVAARSPKSCSVVTASTATSGAATSASLTTGKAKKIVQPPARSKHVKSSDKLELDLQNLLAIKPSKSKSGKVSRSISQVTAAQTGRRTIVSRPVRVLTTSVGKQPRIKGQSRKMPTPVQKYKRLYAQHKQELLLLLADLKRRQDAEQSTDVNTEGFREENRDCSQASSSDLLNSTNNTSVPDVSIISSLLSNTSHAPNNTSDSVAAVETSNSVDDAKSSKKKRKKKHGGGNKSSDVEASSTTAGNCSTKLAVEGTPAQQGPEGAVASTNKAVALSAGPHTPLSPTEAKEIADRLTDELKRLQENNKIIKTNVITRELNLHLISLLQTIVRFQRRSYFHDQIKAKAKRRYVSGIRETHHRLHKIQLLIVAQDAGRKIPVVTESLAALVQDAESQQVPVVFGLNRRRLGGLLCKESGFRVSCVGVMNHQGAEESVKGVMSILPELQRHQQHLNSSQVVDTTNLIMEEEEEEDDVSSSACAGDSGPFPAVTTSSSSSSQSTPAKVAALAESAVVGRSSAQMLKGKNGIRQTGCAAANRGKATGGDDVTRLDMNDKIVNILKEQKKNVCNKKQTS